MAKSVAETEHEDILVKTIQMLKTELGRLPDEQEIYDFVFGTEEDRARVLAGSQK